MNVILTPGTTEPAQSKEFSVAKGQEVTLMVYPEASLGADTATLKIKSPDGTLVTCTDDNGTIALSATRLVEVVVGVGTYVVTTTNRASSWGVAIVG